MNDRQLEALEVAQVLNNMSAGTHNKARSLLVELDSYPPEARAGVLAKAKALLLAVDGWQQQANAWLAAAVKDADYPVQ